MKLNSKKIIILDRDGVINYDSDQYIKSADEWEAIPGSLEAISQLNQAGYHVVIATNQSGIGRRLFDVDTLNAIHEKMHKQLARLGGEIAAIFYCPHIAEDLCQCRKPKIGMYLEIIKRFDLGASLKGVPIVGDSLRDLIGAVTLGANPHLVLTGNGLKTRSSGDLPPYTAIHSNLEDFANHFLEIV